MKLDEPYDKMLGKNLTEIHVGRRSDIGKPNFILD